MKDYIEKALTYTEYESLIDRLLADGKTTGSDHSDARVGFTRLNRQRMNRLEKTVLVTDQLRTAAANIERPMIWLTITEGWCGDAAQNVPVLEKIASVSDKIETRYILRDENPELMDQFLTSGSRSIPKLIALDAATLEVIGTWGPRPAAAQKLHIELKEKGVEKAAINEELQRLYNADKGVSLQKELSDLFSFWGRNKAAAFAK